jgi:hypothetical protein
MTVELFDDVKEYAIPPEAPGMRCINCGNIEDAVIYANRIGPPSRRPNGDDSTRRRWRRIVAVNGSPG